MQQARDPFWISREDGSGEDFIPKGKLLPDNHPLVARAPQLFETVEVADVPAQTKEAPRKGR